MFQNHYHEYLERQLKNLINHVVIIPLDSLLSIEIFSII